MPGLKEETESESRLGSEPWIVLELSLVPLVEDDAVTWPEPGVGLRLRPSVLDNGHNLGLRLDSGIMMVLNTESIRGQR